MCSKRFLISSLILIVLVIFLYFIDSPLLTGFATKIISSAVYCNNPVSIINNPFFTNYVPDIYGRNVVYILANSVSSSSLVFYDGGSDMIYGNGNDPGIIIVPALQFGNQYSLDSEIKIYGNNVIFKRINWQSGLTELLIYSIGNDGVAGTNDDMGPSIIFSQQGLNHPSINSISIDNNLVTFRTVPSYSSYYCFADHPSGSCWTASPQIVSPTITGYNAEKYLGAEIGGVLYHFWQYIYFGSSQSNYRTALHYLESATQQQGFYYSNPYNVNEFLADISYPFLLFTENNLGVASRVKLGLVITNSFRADISPNSVQGMTSFNDLYPSISKSALSNGKYLIAWQRISNTGQRRYIVNSFPLSKEVIISNLNSNLIASSVDGKNVVLGDNTKIYVSECYF